MLQPGTQIGRYEVQRRLGRGGMGIVYVAHDPVLGRMVAIKIFLSDLDMPDAAERFAREARSAAALNHANIVTIHDFGDWQSQPYIVMEYVQGETLAEVIRRKAPVAPAEKLRWMEDLCAGVGYAHRVGVIHRDIKPTNLMLDRSGRLKILDFGIAKMLGTLGSKGTALIGTPGYMAPEQVLGGAIDHRSDLFSIGAVCYELLSYTEAFPGDTVPAITHRIINEEPVSIAQLLPDASADLVAIVERGLKKSAADRFPDAEAFREAIARARHQLESAPGWDVPGKATPFGAPPAAGMAQRGTDSSRKHTSDAVSVAELTPPPDPRKTDREALARRRAAQIDASLELARLCLERQDLDQALDACEQALTLDDTHQPSLALEQSIKAAIAKRRAAAIIADARGELAKGSLTAAQSLLEQARSLDPETPDAKRLERDLRLARVEQERLRARAEAVQKAVALAKSALERSDVEAALRFSREALDLDAESTDARSIEGEAMRLLDDDVAPPGAAATVVAGQPVDRTILAPRRRAPSAAPVTPGTAKRPRIAVPVPKALQTELLVRLRELAAELQRSVRALPVRQQRMIGGTAAAVLLIVAIAAFTMTRRAAVAPTGILVIDAVPWATIVSIQAEDGRNRSLPNPASTPLSLALPIGIYQIRVAGPRPDDGSRAFSVEVREGAVTAAPVERFETPTPEAYFEEYLTAPTPATESIEPAAPAPQGAAPPGAAPPGAVQPLPPSGTPPSGALPSETLPSETLPSGTLPSGTLPSGTLP